MQPRGRRVSFGRGIVQLGLRRRQFGLTRLAFGDVADQEQIAPRIVGSKTVAQGDRDFDPACRIAGAQMLLDPHHRFAITHGGHHAAPFGGNLGAQYVFDPVADDGMRLGRPAKGAGMVEAAIDAVVVHLQQQVGQGGQCQFQLVLGAFKILQGFFPHQGGLDHIGNTAQQVDCFVGKGRLSASAIQTGQTDQFAIHQNGNRDHRQNGLHLENGFLG